MKKRKTSYVLKLDKPNEKKEIEFELNYLQSLTIEQRFQMMVKKTEEIRNLLKNCGFRETPKTIKRT